jgi:P27 family predicted phage terminase small subunit
MSNPKLTKEMKQLRGTYKASRDKPTIRADQALAEVPPPPGSLSTGARLEWVKLAPVAVELSTLTVGDLRAFEQLTECLASASELQTLVAAEGLLIPAANGGKKANPAQRSLETARAQAHRLLCEFGMTPKSRNHVPKAVKPTSNEWDGFRPTRFTALNPERDFKRDGYAAGYDACDFDENGKLIKSKADPEKEARFRQQIDDIRERLRERTADDEERGLQ